MASESLLKEGAAWKRNDSLLDAWSFVHLLAGMAAGWAMDPWIGLLLLGLWEPLEIFVLSPLARKVLNHPFGYETWRNSLSDIVFDAAGVAIGFLALRAVWSPRPPLPLFG